MPMILIGPCMFVAPLLVLLIPVALVLWPPSLLLTGLAWLVLWPFARGDEKSAGVRAHRKVGRWFRTLLTPWTYFDVPKVPPLPGGKRAPAAPGGAPSSTPAAARGVVPVSPAVTAAGTPVPAAAASKSGGPTPP